LHGSSNTDICDVLAQKEHEKTSVPTSLPKF